MAATTSRRAVTVERVIAAPPEPIFAILTDPAMHPVIDGSGTVKQARPSPRLRPGSKFAVGMRMGLPYRVRNVVVEYDDNRRIAWRHFARNIWRYELEPVDGGTRVVETFDYDTPAARILERLGFPERNRQGMVATLERLDRLVTTGSAD